MEAHALDNVHGEFCLGLGLKSGFMGFDRFMTWLYHFVVCLFRGLCYIVPLPLGQRMLLMLLSSI